MMEKTYPNHVMIVRVTVHVISENVWWNISMHENISIPCDRCHETKQVIPDSENSSLGKSDKHVCFEKENHLYMHRCGCGFQWDDKLQTN
jgi:hypothetical protein